MSDENDQEDRTLDASPRRREEAKKEGRGAKSADLSSAIAWVVALSVFTWLLPPLFNSLIHSYRHACELLGNPNYPLVDLPLELGRTGMPVVLALLPLLGIVALAGALAWVLQVGWNPNLENLMPKMERIDPLAAFKRMFSKDGGGRLVVGILKMVLVGGVAYYCISGSIRNSSQWHRLDASEVFYYAATMLKGLCWTIALVMFFIGAVDYGFQYFKFERDIRMTNQEMKEEHKQEEGDPHIKAKIRQIQRQRSMGRMMHDVPTATVVITNPTHFAVALRYDPVTHPTPKVVAKGMNLVAFKIRSIAYENDVTVLEDPPLARALYKAVNIDQEIPPEFYRAIALILANVLRSRTQMTSAAPMVGV